MSGLTEQERESLIVAIRWATEHRAGCTCCPGFADDLAATVDQIANARVKAALEAAAKSITASCVGDPFTKPCKSCRDAARIVRAADTT